MLVLSRFQSEGIRIGDNIRVVVVESGGRVRIGIDAPPEVPIWRDELYEAIQLERRCNEEETDQETD